MSTNDNDGGEPSTPLAAESDGEPDSGESDSGRTTIESSGAQRSPVALAVESDSGQLETVSDPSRDLMFLHSRCETKDGFRVIRSRENRIEIGELQRLREGAPIQGEVVQLEQRSEHQQLFDVKVLLDQDEVRKATGSGPAQVASNAYRAHWEAIFGEPDRSDWPDSDKLN